MSNPYLTAAAHISSGTCDRIDLAWTNGSDAPYDAILVYRNGSLLTTLYAQETEYQDPSVPVGTAYDYYILCGVSYQQSNTTSPITPKSLQAPTIGTLAGKRSGFQNALTPSNVV